MKSLCYALQASSFRACLSACTTCFQLSGTLFVNEIGKQILEMLASKLAGVETNIAKEYYSRISNVSSLNNDISRKSSISMEDNKNETGFKENNLFQQSSKENEALFSLNSHKMDLFSLSFLTSELEPTLKVTNIQGNIQTEYPSKSINNTWLDSLLQICQIDSIHPYSIICSRGLYHFFIMFHPFSQDSKYILFDPNIHESLQLEPGYYSFKSKDNLFKYLNRIFQNNNKPQDRNKSNSYLNNQYQLDDHLDYFVVQLDKIKY